MLFQDSPAVELLVAATLLGNCLTEPFANEAEKFAKQTSAALGKRSNVEYAYI